MNRAALLLAIALLGGPPAARAQTPLSSPPVRGANVDRAVLEVVEFSDFECPFCGFAIGVVDSLVELHGDEVRLVYRHYPLPMHPHAESAARAAVEAHRQGAFWEYHDLLFRHQDRLGDAELVGYADSLRLDSEAFAAALGSAEHAAVVAADVALGRSLAVRGTPTFFVNGYRLVGAPPLWVFEAAIRAFREGKVERRPLTAAEPPDE